MSLFNIARFKANILVPARLQYIDLAAVHVSGHPRKAFTADTKSLVGAKMFASKMFFRAITSRNLGCPPLSPRLCEGDPPAKRPQHPRRWKPQIFPQIGARLAFTRVGDHTCFCRLDYIKNKYDRFIKLSWSARKVIAYYNVCQTMYVSCTFLRNRSLS